jgi:hypothetical protein
VFSMRYGTEFLCGQTKAWDKQSDTHLPVNTRVDMKPGACTLRQSSSLQGAKIRRLPPFPPGGGGLQAGARKQPRCYKYASCSPHAGIVQCFDLHATDRIRIL